MNGQKNHNTIENLATIVKKEIDKAQIPKWDLYLLDEHVFGLYFRQLDYDLQADSHNLTYFLRIFQDKNDNEMGIGLVKSNSSRSEDIKAVISNAKAIATINSSPKYNLVTPGKQYSSPKTTDKEVWDNPANFLLQSGGKIKTALSEFSYQGNPHITFGKFRVYRNQKMLLNSEALNLLKRTTYFCYEFSLKAMNNGKIAEYWPKAYLKSVNDLRFEDYVSQWAKIARDSLIAQPPKHFKSIDVVFPPIIVRTALLNTFGYSITAKALYEKTTHFTAGEQIAVPEFSMSDDGLLPDGLNTSAFDGEGNPKQSTKIIEKGIMKQFLYDQKYAHLLNSHSTGNGTRINGLVDIEMNNLVVEPGTRSLKDIMNEIKIGIYIDAFSWLNPDPITGIFGAEIRNAYMIEDGQLTQPIKGGNVSGNLYEMMKSISGISKETHNIMNARVPFLKFSNISLSGD